jgi:hypothetical protein
MRLIPATLLLALMFALGMCAGAGARDLGQWENADPAVSKWFRDLKQPDNPYLSCCGESDAYWADSFETGPNGELIAIITDTRDDEPLKRQHIPPGTRFVVPPNKVKFDGGNPTGHFVIFIGPGDQIYCYVTGTLG